MRILKANSFITLDGVMQAPGGPDEDRSGGFEHGGWMMKYWDSRMHDILRASMSKPFDILQTLIKHGLIDEFRIRTFPLMLGVGKRLFDSGTVPAGLDLVDSVVSTTGVTIGTYKTGAEIGYRSFAAESSKNELNRREKVAHEATR